MKLETFLSDPLEDRARWMQGLHTASTGFYENEVGAGIGAVLVVREQTSGRVLAIRKAERKDYELGGCWAFPGGMVRWSRRGEPIQEACARSLCLRVKSETGFEPARDAMGRYVPADPPPISSYTAKGARRHTIVLAFETEVASPVPVRAGDPSITEARWMAPIEALQSMAPANTVIAARLLWPLLDEHGRATAAAAVRAALDNCTGWAAEVGLPAPSAMEPGLSGLKAAP